MTTQKKIRNLYGGPQNDPVRPDAQQESVSSCGGFGADSEENPSNFASDVRQLAAALGRRNAEAMKPDHKAKQKNRAAVSAALERIFQEQKS